MIYPFLLLHNLKGHRFHLEIIYYTIIIQSRFSYPYSEWLVCNLSSMPIDRGYSRSNILLRTKKREAGSCPQRSLLCRTYYTEWQRTKKTEFVAMNWPESADKDLILRSGKDTRTNESAEVSKNGYSKIILDRAIQIIKTEKRILQLLRFSFYHENLSLWLGITVSKFPYSVLCSLEQSPVTATHLKFTEIWSSFPSYFLFLTPTPPCFVVYLNKSEP